ncbi:MAG TPA: chemotaxis protein CheX [Vicinamibacterales bacterium]|nr:chemotaxis protein CheX [Vicinamibacterales bacterium]
MSLSKSPAQSAKAGEALRDSFIDVCENSFFAYVEACDAHRFAVLAEECSRSARAVQESGGYTAQRASPSEWLKSSVSFTGTFSGAIEVILPERLARTLIASLLGEPADSDFAEHQVFDGLGEFANMICGAWLTNMSQRTAFNLRPPAVTRMVSDWSPLTDSNWADGQGHAMAVNDLPVRLRFRPMAG